MNRRNVVLNGFVALWWSFLGTNYAYSEMLVGKAEAEAMSRVAEKMWREDLKKALEKDSDEEKQAAGGLPVVSDLKVEKLNQDIQKMFYEFYELYSDEIQEIVNSHVDPLQDVVSALRRCSVAPGGAEFNNSSQNNTLNNKKMRKVFFAHQREKINQFLPQFIPLPAVTDEDIAYLMQQYPVEFKKIESFNRHSKVRKIAQSSSWRAISLIQSKMKGFKAAQTKTPVGLYKAVFGAYPDLTECYQEELNRVFTPDEAQAKYREWNQNPMLPLVCTTIAEDALLAKWIWFITGRQVSIMSAARNEYMRRGRELVLVNNARDEMVFGMIGMSTYFFGEAKDVEEVQAHAMVSNYLGFQYSQPVAVNQAPHGRPIEDYMNNFFIIHPAGLVGERDLTGIILGGSFDGDEDSARSSDRIIDTNKIRNNNVGNRLAEELL